jgi:hypothetical protein
LVMLGLHAETPQSRQRNACCLFAQEELPRAREEIQENPPKLR